MLTIQMFTTVHISGISAGKGLGQHTTAESRMGSAVAFLLPRLSARMETSRAVSGDKWLAVEQWVFPTLLAITDGSRQVEERWPESRCEGAAFFAESL